MSAQTILFIIILIISSEFFLNRILSFLNIKSLKDAPQPLLDTIYPKEKIKQTYQYLKENNKFSTIISSISFVITIILLLSGFFGKLDDFLRTFIKDDILLSIVFLAILYFGSDIFSIPFQLYHTFVIEEKYGFNKTSIKTFFIDKAKNYALSIIFGGTILSILLLLIQALGPNFWVYFWAVVVVFIFFTNLLYTSVIIPLFNKLTPLKEGELKQAIEEYSKKVNFPLNSILVIDGSKRSSKANAFFSGFGKKKKIVLYDTLIEKHPASELIAVLAHEVGHYKMKHIQSSLIYSIIQVGFVLFILSLFIFSPSLSQALGAKQISVHINLIAFSLLFSPISTIGSLFSNAQSRKNEFEADAFAAKTSDGENLISALKKLSVDHLSNPFPHRTYVFFNYSHPPIIKRIEAIKKISSKDTTV